MADNNERRNAIDLCIALKKMPHVFDRIKAVWGYAEFFDTVDDLLLVEPGRETRAGFPEGVYKELEALKRLFIKYPDDVMPTYFNDAEREQVWEIVNEIRARLNFSSGERL